MQMITLTTSESQVPGDIVEAAGGFFWWYVDVIDAQGDGFVIIAAFGLPFLPGYASAQRQGHPQRPAERPSINVVLYRSGRPVYYALREISPSAARWLPDAGRIELGGTTLEARAEGDHLELHGHLDLTLPRCGGTLRGDFRVQGPRCRHAAPLPPAGPHRWSPLIPRGTGEGRFTLNGAPLMELRGEAYHDRNASTRPLHGLGIDHWIWGRATLGDEVLIWYLLWPQTGEDPTCIALRIDAAGRAIPVPDLRVHLPPARRTFFGMRWWPTLELHSAGAPWLTIRHRERVDDGPFYLRFQVAVERGDLRGQGWGELVDPERVDLARHRPLVRMRVQPARGPASFWLPLFAGPTRGRIRRLLTPTPRRSAAHTLPATPEEAS